MRSDLFPSAVHGDWDVATVLEEMESEGMVVQRTVNHEVQVANILLFTYQSWLVSFWGYSFL